MVALKTAASQRRSVWRELAAVPKAVRQEHS
jgi:hypothetical protein